MFAALLCTAILGQNYVRVTHAPVYPAHCNRYYQTISIPLYSPWNETVNNVRAALAAKPKSLPNSSEWAALEEADAAVKDAWTILLASPKWKKAELREAYYAAKRAREELRKEVCFQMNRRRNHDIYE